MMRLRVLLTIAVVVVLLCASCSDGLAKNPCTGTTTIEMTECAVAQLRDAEEHLRRSVAEIRLQLAERPAALAAFDASQKAWVAFVDADGKAVEEHVKDGSIRSLSVLGSRASHTYNRTCELWWMYLEGMATKLVRPPHCRAGSDDAKPRD